MLRHRRVTPHSALPESPPEIEGLAWACHAHPTPIEWMLPGAIPAGSFVLLEGRKSTGKSSVAAAIAAAVTGGPIPPGWIGPRDRRVIWIASEDPWDSVVVPRLTAAGADINRVARLMAADLHGKARRPQLPQDLELLDHAIISSRAALLVMDPYITLAPSTTDVRVEQQARAYLQPIVDLAEQRKCVVLAIRHIRKGQSGDARDAGLGASGIGNLARAILRCDEHPHQSGQFVMSAVATNWGRKLATQIYRIVDTPNHQPRIEWCGISDLDADSIAEGRGMEADRDEWADADRILCASIGAAWVQVSQVLREAELAGVSPRTLRRAKARLRVPSRRMRYGQEGYWEWGPPANGWPDGLVDPGPVEGGADAPPAPMATKGAKAPRKPRKSPKAPKVATSPDAPTKAPPEEEVSNGEHE